MRKFLSVLLATIMVMMLVVSVSAAEVEPAQKMISQKTVQLPSEPNSIKEETTTIYDDGSVMVEVLTVRYDRTRANSGTAYTENSVTFKTSQGTINALLDMEATFTYDGNANTVSCTHKSFTVEALNGWRVTKKAMTTKTSGTLVKKLTVGAPITLVNDRSYSRSAWIACDANGKVTKSPATST